jgi:hypothetical protein
MDVHAKLEAEIFRNIRAAIAATKLGQILWSIRYLERAMYLSRVQSKLAALSAPGAKPRGHD